MRWERSDFLGSSAETARRLIGAVLVHETDEGRTAGRITECEAYGGRYRGKADDASHGYKGMTERTRIMFAVGGYAYVYLIYGMYYCMNVVCGTAGEGAAVLIRSVEPLEGVDIMRQRRHGAEGRKLTVGPGRLAMAMGITGSHNGMNLIGGSLYIEQGDKKRYPADRSVRIHIDYAVHGKHFPWRYTLRGSEWVSKR